MEISHKSFSRKFINLQWYKTETPLHVRIHPLVIGLTFSKLQKVLEQIEMDESLK